MKTLEQIAYHESGHAVAFMQLGFGFRFASIVPDAKSAGAVLPGCKEPREWKDAFFYSVATAAGPAAEARLNRDALSLSGSNDLKQIIKSILGHKVPNPQKALIEVNHAAEFFAKEAWNDIRRFAAYLLENDFVTSSSMQQISMWRAEMEHFKKWAPAMRNQIRVALLEKEFEDDKPQSVAAPAAFDEYEEVYKR